MCIIILMQMIPMTRQIQKWMKMQYHSRKILEVFIEYLCSYLYNCFDVYNKFMFIGFKWPHDAVLLLIEEYRVRQNDFSAVKMSHKKIWGLISEVMIKHGYNVSGPQCLSKFSGLKRTYKTVKDHNQKSGNAARTWPYFAVRHTYT